MITNIAAYCKRLIKITDVLIKHPIYFRHLIGALGYSNASWKNLHKFEARGSVMTHKRINKYLKNNGNPFKLMLNRTRMCGKNLCLVTNSPGELYSNQESIRLGFVSNGRSDIEFMYYWEMLCSMSVASFMMTKFPDLKLFKGKKNPQQELLAMGSSYGESVRNRYVSLFPN